MSSFLFKPKPVLTQKIPIFGYLVELLNIIYSSKSLVEIYEYIDINPHINFNKDQRCINLFNHRVFFYLSKIDLSIIDADSQAYSHEKDMNSLPKRMIELFISRGWDINKRDYENKTPLDRIQNIKRWSPIEPHEYPSMDTWIEVLIELEATSTENS